MKKRITDFCKDKFNNEFIISYYDSKKTIVRTIALEPTPPIEISPVHTLLKFVKNDV